MSKTTAATQAKADRHGSLYTREERAIIDPYKTQYIQATSPGERKRIAQHHILPKIFTYWQGKGIVIDRPEEQTEVLSQLIFRRVQTNHHCKRES